MPVLDIPAGPQVKWGDRRRSRVRIKRRFSWIFWADGEPAAGTPTILQVELNFPRELFADSGALFDSFVRAGAAFVAEARKRRAVRGKALTVRCCLPLPSNPKARLTLSRERLPLLKKEDGEVLGASLASACLTPSVSRLVHTPPRRGGLYLRRLTLQLPAALMAAHSLVALPPKPGNQSLPQNIEQIFMDDDELTRYREHVKLLGWNPLHATVVGLVDRAFRGAWEKADHAGLLYTASKDVALVRKARRPVLAAQALRYRDPTDVLREYHYGRKRESQTNRIINLAKTRRHIYDRLLKSWTRTYLGEPGAAAREFRLL